MSNYNKKVKKALIKINIIELVNNTLKNISKVITPTIIPIIKTM